MKAAQAMGRLRAAEEHFVEAQEERRQAILDAVRADVPLRDVAELARCSHETIRRIVAAHGAVAIALDGQEYVLPGQTIDLLIYKLAGNARGSFPKDVQLLKAGDRWLAAAGVLADELHAAMADDDGNPIEVDEPRAFALWQVLRATEMMRPSTLHDVAERLRQRYGYPPYPAASLRRWTRAT
jgi:hypothetical protein